MWITKWTLSIITPTAKKNIGQVNVLHVRMGTGNRGAISVLRIGPIRMQAMAYAMIMINTPRLKTGMIFVFNGKG